MIATVRALAVVVCAVVLVACSDGDLVREAHPTALTGTAWRVVWINGQAPGAGSEPTAVFSSTDVKGSAGCNSYGGHYDYDPATGRLALRDLGMTAMLCAEQERNRVEAAFTNALGKAASASIDPAGRLVLSGPGGEIVLAVDAVGGRGPAGTGDLDGTIGRSARRSDGRATSGNRRREESPSTAAQGSGQHPSAARRGPAPQ